MILSFLVNTFTEWGQWGGCNVTCGDGYQIRKRSCSITPCDNSTLTEYKNCTGPCGMFCCITYYERKSVMQAVADFCQSYKCQLQIC